VWLEALRWATVVGFKMSSCKQRNGASNGYIYVYFSMGIRMPGNSYNTFNIPICTYAESKQSADNDFRLLFGVPLMTSSRKRFVRLFAAFACPFLVIAVLLPISADTIKN